MRKKYTTKDFIEKAQIVHGDIYNYSLVEYVDSISKISIICNKHGVFKQEGASHLRGYGCPICSGKSKSNTEEFIKKAGLKHGDKYDYSLVIYKNNSSLVDIICQEHGIFKQIPNAHLNGQGCPKCKINYKISREKFIEKAILVHNDKYDYSLVIYLNDSSKVNIVCKEHGIFKQSPNNHLAGAGCKSCYESKGEKAIKKYLEYKGIKYISQHSFDGCKDKRKLYFDFFLPDYNLLIEYDGEQHYKSIKHYGGDIGFKKRQEYDKIKNIFAKNNNINLLRIKFNEFNDIDKILINNIK